MTRRLVWRAAFAGVVALSLVMLFTPASGVPSGFVVNDKVVHFLLFNALAVTGRLAGVSTVPLAISLAAYAGISEVLQTALPIDRDGTVRDAVADVLGVVTGLVVVAVATSRRRAQ